MDYSKAVRIARAVSGIQQKELAEKAGLNASHVLLIEKGSRKPSVGAIEKLCKAFRIPEPLFTLLVAEAA
jgi:transcriptional regulator with XRE-family HTH domain